jgi:spore germination protein YaaH
MKFKKLFYLLIFFFITSTSPSLSLVGEEQNIKNIEKLWYFKEEQKSRESFFKNYSKIDVLAPQTFYLRFDYKKNEFYIESKMKDDIVNFAKEKNIKVLPLLANISFNKKGNEYFDRFLIQKLLNDKKAQEKIVKDIIDISKKYNTEAQVVVGWQLDLEAISGEYKDKFSEFTKYFDAELGKNNLISSAAIVSKISDNPKDYEKIYWEKWSSVYDYKKLGEYLDFISVMAYDQPQSPGPVATIDWSKKVLEYSLKNIPANKISFGVPSYAWAYRSTELKNGKKHFAMTNFELVSKYLTPNSGEGNKVTGKGRNEKYGNIPWISYDRGGKNYTIWYEDKMSFETKLKNIKSLPTSLYQGSSIRGFSVWVLGDEDPKVWELF